MAIPIMRCRFSFVNIAHTGLLTTYWQPGTTGGSTADATDVLTRVRAWLNAAKASIITGVTFTPIATCDVLDAQNGHLIGSFTGTPPASIAGTAAGDAMPVQTAFIIKWLTSSVLDNHKVQGRTFLTGAGEGMNNSVGVPNAADVTLHQTSAATLLTPGATASALTVWHRPKYDNSKPPVLLRQGNVGLVTGVQVDGVKWGSQRMRRYH